jgi:hypothetical protein
VQGQRALTARFVEWFGQHPFLAGIAPAR